ncbi:MAG: response regulator [Syntrophomonadaceae bacterium]|nr:response regulator [Syntrophomonadaceae bacterium]
MKILLADDSQFFKNFLLRIFNEYLPDALIYQAGNGQEAFQIYHNEKPDFVLTDLLMPGINGHELVRLIKESDHEAKIIVLSADIQKSTREEIEAMGVIDFINKPLNNEKATQLLNLIKEACDA